MHTFLRADLVFKSSYICDQYYCTQTVQYYQLHNATVIKQINTELIKDDIFHRLTSPYSIPIKGHYLSQSNLTSHGRKQAIRKMTLL